MAAVTGAVIAAGATAYAANRQSAAAKDAAGAGRDASNAAIAEQRAAREQYITPYSNAGIGALGQLQALNAGDFSSFQESPDYQFRFDQGLQGLDRSAAARGAVNAGGTDADRIAYGQGQASQAYGDYYNRIFNLAQMGQQAGSAGVGVASNIGNYLGQGAAAQGMGSIGSANAWSNAAGGLAGLAGQYMGGRQSGYANSYQNNPGYLQPIQRETFTPDTSLNLGGYGG